MYKCDLFSKISSCSLMFYSDQNTFLRCLEHLQVVVPLKMDIWSLSKIESSAIFTRG